jgi:hypothetical protein
MLVPVERRISITFDEQMANFADCYFAPFIIDDLCLESRSHLTAAPRSGLSWGVGKKIVRRFS